jgi:hypothetical protein
MVTGNLKQVAASMNIPYDTLKVWKASKWWREMALDIKTEGHLALSHRMQKIADKAMEATLDRLENGDYVHDQRTGEIVRKPVSMRDAHQAAVSFQDRALKLQDSPDQEASQLAVHDRLAQLADAFSKMAGKTRKLDVIDVEPKEICYAEEDGTGAEETGSEEGSDRGTEGQLHLRDHAEDGLEAQAGDSVDAIPEEREEGLRP